MRHSLIFLSIILFLVTGSSVAHAESATTTVILNVDPIPNVVPTSTPPTSSGYIQTDTSFVKPAFYISTIGITQQQTSVTITWETSTESHATVSWGMTPDYEISAVAETVNEFNHSVVIRALKPNTRYYFQIMGIDRYGSRLTYAASFTTASAADHAPPANVTNPTISPTQNGLRISWINPHEDDFAGVRMTRSPYHYPYDRNDGRVIYEGTGSSVIDASADPNTLYYYTIFSFDTSGNYSSGTIFTSQSTSGLVDEEVTSPSVKRIIYPFAYLYFVQDDTLIVATSTEISVSSQSGIVVIVPKELLPTPLKRGYVFVGDGEHQTTYQLREIDADNAYETTIDLSSMTSGSYLLSINGLTASSTVIDISGTMRVHHVTMSFWQKIFYSTTFSYTLSVILLLILLIIILKVF